MKYVIYIERPMYIASKDTGYPDGHNSVAYALRNSLEPLLKVPWLFSVTLFTCVCPDRSTRLT